MNMKDIEAVYAELLKQLDWRGPSGKTQGHIVLSRPQALILVQWMDLHMQMDTLDDELKDLIGDDARQAARSPDQAEQ